MSKTIRNKHLKIIGLLQEAAVTVSRLIDSGKLDEGIQLLTECQDSAIALGNHIEKLHGLQTKTVAILEQYCNTLYQVSVAMTEKENQVQTALLELAAVTDLVQSTYTQEFPEKKEVVFLPYNASMWDSLESVWMAARDDENCDAYVVPIPYYDLDVNRNFIEKHYEGDLYPDYVPITHYEEYDLEERHPDMIFIHNPYDEGNRVTSIAPEFYSSRIKDFTEKLVYIPYFVLPEIHPDNQASIDNIKQFCYLPGIIHADKVIVQSEDMRQIYINEYLKAAHFCGERITREVLEEKILGLGSPKFDKAVNTKKEDLEIPSEWLKVIEKPDGSWKKIIFYNTSIAALLKTNEQMLAKIKDVLRTFKENQNEVALLWRPHPLMMQTIESMRPELRNAYKALVNQYQEEGWGIYDDSADMNRAVVLSDAYYGDHSSVVQVYQETGKPVMIQDVGLESSNREVINLSIGAGVIYKNELFFTEFWIGGLFKLDLDTGNICFIKQIQNKLDGFMMYRNAYIEGNHMWLIPWKALKFAKVDLETYEVEYHDKIDKEYQTEDEIRVFDRIWKLTLKNNEESALQSVDIFTNEVEIWGEERGLAPNWRCGMRNLSLKDELAIVTRGYLNLFNPRLNKFKNYHLQISKEVVSEWLNARIENNTNIILNEVYAPLDMYFKRILNKRFCLSKNRISGERIFEESKND